MKKLLYLIFISILPFFLFSCGKSKEQKSFEKTKSIEKNLESKTTKFLKMISQNDAYLKWNFSLPSNVAFFENILGEPDSIYYDKDEFCPIGQVLTWIVEDENLTISIVADSYQNQLKPTDEVRLVAFKPMRRNRPNPLITLNGIRFDTSESDVKARLKRYMVTAPNFTLISYKEPSVFDSKYSKEEFTYYQMTNQEYFFHFAIDKSGIFRYVFLSSFDIRKAC